jgi:transcriptional regulator with XRE-family HTH domain
MDATIAQTVRQRRQQLRLSQTEAAQQAKLSRRTWCEIENGHRHPSDTTLLAIEDTLKLPSGSLVALALEPADDELAAIRRELIGLVNMLLTKEDMEVARVHLARQRADILEAQLGQRSDGRRTGRPVVG